MRKTLMIFAILSLFGFWVNAQTVGTGQLKITFNATNGGVTVSSILDGNTEVLHVADELFTLFLRNLNNSEAATITSAANWGSTDVSLSNGGSDCTITFANPNMTNVPASLTATVTVHTAGGKSEWDLSVTGVGANHSLMDAYFPHLIIEGNGGNFLVPHYSGEKMANPGAGIDYEAVYPHGWGATMQFLAYYGGVADLYFGFHDPAGFIKTFRVHNESGGVLMEGRVPVPNKTLAGNDWDFPGHFELDLFSGDWWEAAMIYKTWASSSAEYWPEDTGARHLRQANLGKIGVWCEEWCIYLGNARSIGSIQTGIQDFIDIFSDEVTVGSHVYAWQGLPFDDNYPEIFPPMDGFGDMVNSLQANNNAYIMPYFNGSMWDTTLASFHPDGRNHSAKKEDGSVYGATFGDDVPFAFVCPSETAWSDILADAGNQLSNTYHARALYFDQVTAVRAFQCYDSDHNHPLGGGAYWREGFESAFQAITATGNIPEGVFVTSEGGCDFLANVVDGFLTERWVGDNLVPAFQAIYGGKIQLFGAKAGTSYYNDPVFYDRIAKGVTYGMQPGRFASWLAHDDDSQENALPFVRQIATIRARISDFYTFGEMQPPVQYGPADVVSSVWKLGDSLVLTLINRSMTDAHDFDINLTGSQYGLNGDMAFREITEASNSAFTNANSNTVSQHVTLQKMGAVSYVMTPESVLDVELFAFHGIKRKEGILLSWKTESEEKFKEFQVEHSKDGFRWDIIGTVAGRGDSFSENAYKYYDKNPAPGHNYYRLKKVDVGGHYSYSNVINVYFDKVEISIYPNPAKGQLTILTKGKGVDRFLLYNSLGQPVFDSVSGETTYDVSHLTKGIYYAVVIVKGEKFRRRVVLN